jgi:hypothetical protein
MSDVVRRTETLGEQLAILDPDAISETAGFEYLGRQIWIGERSY